MTIEDWCNKIELIHLYSPPGGGRPRIGEAGRGMAAESVLEYVYTLSKVSDSSPYSSSVFFARNERKIHLPLGGRYRR